MVSFAIDILFWGGGFRLGYPAPGYSRGSRGLKAGANPTDVAGGAHVHKSVMPVTVYCNQLQTITVRLNFRTLSFPFTPHFSAMVLRRGMTFETE